jgi:hypothetical protein
MQFNTHSSFPYSYSICKIDGKNSPIKNEVNSHLLSSFCKHIFMFSSIGLLEKLEYSYVFSVHAYAMLFHDKETS